MPRRPPQPKAPSRAARELWAYVFLAVLCLLLYGHTLRFQFTGVDDTGPLVEQARFVADWRNAPAAFTTPFFGGPADVRYYRPLVTLTYMMDAAWSGTQPAGFHLTNVALHVVATMLFFAVARRLRFPVHTSLAAAAVFGVHPSLTEAVAWVPGRGDMLLGIWLLAAMVCLLRMAAGHRTALPAHLLFVLAALLTKEAAVALPFVFMSYVLLADEAAPLRRNIGLWLGWLAVLALWIALRSAALGTAEGTGRFASPLAHLPALLMYLGKAVWPHRLSVLATYADTPWWPGLLGAAGLVAAGALAQGSRRRLCLWAASAFVLLLAPSLAVSDYLLLEIRLYAPLLMLLLAAACALEPLGARRPTLVHAAMAVVVLGLAVRASVYSAAFRDPDAFTAQAVSSAPHSALAHVHRGIVLQRAGHRDEAERSYRRALELDPRHAIAHNNLGLICLARGEYAAAEAHFQAELHIDPASDKTHYNLARLRLEQGRIDDAAAALREAVRLNPDNVSALDGLAQYYELKGDLPAAARYREEVRQRR